MNIRTPKLVAATLWVLIAAGWGGFTGSALATSNSIPFSDNFDTLFYYDVGTFLDSGTNGWYGSSSNVMVTNGCTLPDSTNMAIIPIDCTLSNRFEPAAGTNIWLQMDLKVAHYDGTNVPVVDTNKTAMFYVNTNGHFVVHNGPANPQTNSLSWVTLATDITGQPAISNADGEWVRLNIHHDYAHTNWTVFVNYVLMTNDIEFINTAITNFSGFDLYSGNSTSYLDNIFVMATNPPDLQAHGSNWLPHMTVSPQGVTNAVMRGKNADSNNFEVAHTAGYYALRFTNTDDAAWILATAPSAATITNATSRVDVVYDTTGLAAGSYTGVVTVTGFDSTFGFTASNSPQTFQVVMDVMELTVNPVGMTNTILYGRNASPQTFTIANTGAGSFNYTNTSLTNWITVGPAAGALGAGVVQIVTNTYPTAGLALGTHTGTVRVASTSGGGDTQTVAVVMQVMDLQLPLGLTNNVMKGRPSSQTFNVEKLGGGELAYTISTNGYAWVSLSQTNGVLTNADSQTITVFYAADLPNGVTTGSLTVATDAGGGITQDVALVVNVMELNVPGALTNTVMKGHASSQTFDVANLGAGELNYTIDTNAYDWVSLSATNGVLTNAFTNTITINYAPTLPSGVTTGFLTVASDSGGGITQNVALVVEVMELMRAPAGFTNTFLPGYEPPAESFILANAGAGVFGYQIASDALWATPSSNSGTLGAGQTNSIILTFGSTADWQPGISNAVVTICSTNGGGDTQTVAIVFNVMELLPPAGVTASKGTFADKVQVTWTAVTNATGYQVWRNTANDTNTAENLGPITAESYDDLTALQEVVYYYWVKSTNTLGVSGFGVPDTGYRSQGTPPAPAGVTASDGTYTDKVAIVWQAAAGAVSYEVWRNTAADTGTAAKISSPDPTGTSYDDASAAGGVRYYYWVKSKGSNDLTSAFSAPDTGWRALSASGITASEGLRREIRVTWDEVSGATSYELWRNVVEDLSSAEMLTSGTALAYRDLNVEPSAIYFYWVKAVSDVETKVNGPDTGWCSGRKWDFTGDGRADAWYFNVSVGRWYVVPTSNVVQTVLFGNAGMTAVPDDYDGDGKADPAVYEESSGTWLVMLSGSGYATTGAAGLGAPGYTATPGDYDGDGKADPAVYEENMGIWYAWLSGSSYALAAAVGYGAPGYRPVPADYDGDGKTDPAVYQEASGNWFLMLSGNGYVPQYVHFGGLGYTPAPGEYTGLGLADVAVYHEASGYWYVLAGLDESEPSISVHFGAPGYSPISADYDGDGYDDVAVFYRDRHDALWYLQKSHEGFQIISGRESRP